jgi:hypothetical protein
MAEEFTRRLSERFDDAHHASNVQRTAKYFGVGEDRPYDGARFESYDLQESDVDRIVPADLVAVTLLSMEIRKDSRSGISTSDALAIEDFTDEITALLEQIPSKKDLHTLTSDECAHLIDDGSYGDRLWNLLRYEVGMHRVATFKLLARKRPRLFPIADSRTERALGAQENWWRSWRDALSERSEIVTELGRIRDQVMLNTPAAGKISLLRVADIALWTPLS